MTVEYQNPMHAEPRIPLRERINVRLIIFFGVIGLIIGYPVFWYVREQVTGGITDAGGGYLEVNLKSMSTFTFDQQNGKLEEIPKRWRELDGKKVVLRGELWSPTGAADEVDRFALVYSIAKCCVQGTSLVQHLVHSKPMPGKRIEYFEGQVEARGVLHIDIKKDSAGGIASIYQFDVESLKPAR